MRQIIWCSWKNNHLLEQSLAGLRDIDLYVAHHQKSAFEGIAKEFFFFEVSFPESIDNIKHFCRSSHESLVHLHVYYAIITGSSHIKDYSLPCNKLSSADGFAGFGKISIPCEKDRQAIFLIRYFLKATSLTGAAIFLRDKKDYYDEWRFLCESEFDEPIVGQMLLNSAELGDLTFLQRSFSSNNPLVRLSAGIRLRAQLSAFRRISVLGGIWTGGIAICLRVSRKIFSIKKRAVKHGAVIAISGADGSGKSSVLAAVREIYGKQIQTQQLHFGIPNLTLIDRVIGLGVRRLRQSTGLAANGVRPCPGKQTPVLKALALAHLAYRRHKLSVEARRLAGHGILVLIDRYAHDSEVSIDGPKIANSGRGLTRILSRIEKHFYQAIPPCDLGIQLRVSEATAIERNISRNKVGKENDAEIIARHTMTNELTIKASRLIYYDNNGSLATGVTAVCAEIDRQLVSE